MENYHKIIIKYRPYLFVCLGSGRLKWRAPTLNLLYSLISIRRVSLSTTERVWYINYDVISYFCICEENKYDMVYKKPQGDLSFTERNFWNVYRINRKSLDVEEGDTKILSEKNQILYKIWLKVWNKGAFLNCEWTHLCKNWET